jgi:hypothetical protein
MGGSISRINGRSEKWGSIVASFRGLGLVRDGFNGHVSLHFRDGRPVRYEVREVRTISQTIDIGQNERLDCKKT